MSATAVRVADGAPAQVCAMPDEMTDVTKDETTDVRSDAGARRRARAPAHAPKKTRETTKTGADEPSRSTVDFVLDTTELIEW